MIQRIAGLIAATSFLAGCTGDTPVSAPQRPEAGTVESQSFAKIPDVRRLEPSVVTVFTRQGSGSGVVYKADGVIVTNAHVLGQATQTQIGFADGQRTEGTVVAKDEVTDLALIRTERKGLPAVKFATAVPAPGELVLAMGTPLGFANSVTAGIVSGLGREIPGSATRTRALVDLIQTDAAISPGNSGGALVNTEGEVVGINEAYIPPQAGAVSLGFAIPASTVTDVAEELLEDGVASHPFVGIAVTRITPELADAMDLASSTGALVREVLPGGPAAAAGVREGDVITKFDDTDVRTVEEFFGALRDVEPSDQVVLRIRRGGDTVEVDLTAGRLPR
jgi:serine protease DegQ